jgi:hypothetical protein
MTLVGFRTSGGHLGQYLSDDPELARRFSELRVGDQVPEIRNPWGVGWMKGGALGIYIGVVYPNEVSETLGDIPL